MDQSRWGLATLANKHPELAFITSGLAFLAIKHLGLASLNEPPEKLQLLINIRDWLHLLIIIY